MLNKTLNQQVKQHKAMLMQVACQKHEYIEVEMTTFPVNTAKKWLQCKYCGKLYGDNK